MITLKRSVVDQKLLDDKTIIGNNSTEECRPAANVCIQLGSVTLTSIPYDLDTRPWPRRTCLPKMKFLGQGFQKLEHEQDTHTHIYIYRETDRQTDVTELIRGRQQ